MISFIFSKYHWEYVSLNQRFYLIYTGCAFGYGKKFDKCLFIGWSVAVFFLVD